MKKFYLFALVVTMFASCVTDATQDTTVDIETPETLTVSFEDVNSRIQLQENKTVWTAGDLVSVFYRSNANQKWQYQGETGERNGTLKRVTNAEATQELSNIVVVYPYSENYFINARTCNVEVSLPAIQTYLADSYGLNGNIMISSSEYNQFALKSVCGWLKVQLTGNGEKVKSITLKGNNGEQVAGQIYINSADATCVLASDSGASNDDSVAGGSLVFDDTILTEVTLDCGEGVTLSEEATAFYIALPPQKFEGGLTLDINTADGTKMVKSTSNTITIERNTIQPMATFEGEFELNIPNNEIWYTTTTGEKAALFEEEYMISRYNITAHTYDEANDVWILRTGNEKWTEFPNIDTILFKNPSVVNSVYMPNCIETINGALRYTIIASIKLPTNLKSIGDRTFEGCVKLESVTIPNGVTSIGNNAFAMCTSLNNLEIPNSVATFNLDCIGGGYYENKGTRLTKLTIGSGVTEITGRYRMEFGGVISELYLKPNTPPTNIKALFYDVSSFQTTIISRMKIYVPIGSEEAYKQALTWENYSLDSIIIGVNF